MTFALGGLTREVEDRRRPPGHLVSDGPSLPRRAGAEAIGTFALVFAGCGAIITDVESNGALGVVGVGLVFGLVILVMIAALGHVSGAHFNPAVSVSFWLTRHLPGREAMTYIAAQIGGAVVAALLLWAVWPDQPADLGATVPSIAVGRALLLEAVMSAFLMLVIISVATDTRAVGAPAAIAIGGTVALDAMFGGPLTGASMNPARSFGPALVSGQFQTSGSTSSDPLSAPPRERSATSWFAANIRATWQRRRPASGHSAVRVPAQRRALADERSAVRARRERPSPRALRWYHPG